MRHIKWLVAMAAVLAFGLTAVGCGDDDDTSTSSTTATETSSEDTGGGTADAGSTGTTGDDVLAACQDAIAGTPAESAGEAGCQAAADAFDTCAEKADSLSGGAAETAVKACQDTADAAVKALEAGSG